jgi:hypothetical protein
MFHFSWYSARRAMYSHDGNARMHWVAPFGDPRIKACIGSPGLIAVFHVLHRQVTPRHPSVAFFRFINDRHMLGAYLTNIYITFKEQKPMFGLSFPCLNGGPRWT